MPGPDFPQSLVALLPRLRRYARLLSGAGADDLVQDTVERALARRGQWHPGSDLRAWLFAIMHNRWADLSRAAGREPFERTGEDVEPDVAEPPPSLERLDLISAFERLDAEHRQVLMLVAVEQLSYGEAARALGVPAGTVMSRLSRARRRLRELVDGDGHAPGDAGATTRLKRVK